MTGLLLLFLILGAMAGTAHFMMIARDARLLVQGKGALSAIGLRLARFLLPTALLIVAARQGWPMLLAAAIGILIARQIVINLLREAL